MNDLLRAALERNKELAKEGAKEVIRLLELVVNDELDALSEELSRAPEQFGSWERLIKAKLLAERAAGRAESYFAVMAVIEDVVKAGLRIGIGAASAAL